MLIISRQYAIENGLSRYFTGKPCKHGHVSERFVCNHSCVSCIDKEKCRLRAKEWRNNNLARHKERVHQYYEKNKTKANERSKLWYRENKEHCIEQAQLWHQNNREKANAISREWRQRNKEKKAAICRNWAARNPEKIRLYLVNRRSLHNNADGSFTEEDIKRILQMQHNKCAYCCKNIKRAFEIDHIIPLSRGGTNFARNIQLLCRYGCNQKKGALDPIDFSRKNGLLL